jgi:serine/threonine protein kinase
MTLVLCNRSDGSDFLITKRLGSGSYGEAYLGHNTTSNTPYVFKLYRFGKLQRKKMMREILVTQSVCGHPNIIKLQHVIKQTLTDYPILVFEYVKDTYYRDLYPKLTPEDVRFYMFKLFDAMAFAHEKGVMHKDLKPANVMIDHDTHTLKVIDWGLSQFYVKGKSVLNVHQLVDVCYEACSSAVSLTMMLFPLYCRRITVYRRQHVLQVPRDADGLRQERAQHGHLVDGLHVRRHALPDGHFLCWGRRVRPSFDHSEGRIQPLFYPSITTTH